MKNEDLSAKLFISKLRESIEQELLFLIGGSVRDYLLQREFQDYDFLLDGDLSAYVSRLKEKIGGKVIFNKRLMTVTFKLQDVTLDFARARKEYYSKPGVLPQVTPTCWQEDLKRRDFTINTLAVQLLKEGWGEVIDSWGGRKDLECGLIRILHEQSFRDDPTRTLRAIRYKNRLGFTIEKDSLALLQNSWPYLRMVSPRRRLKEWQLLCNEDTVCENIKDIFALGGWQSFMHSFSPEEDLWAEKKLLFPSKNVPKDLRPWFLYLLLLLVKEPEKLADIAEYWGLYSQEKESLEQTLILISTQKQLRRLKKRQLFSKLKELPLEASYYLFWQNPAWGDSWEDFYQELIFYKMPLQGRDLLEIGMKPGPDLGKLLQRLEECYQQNFFNSKEEGLKLVYRILKEENQ